MLQANRSDRSRGYKYPFTCVRLGWLLELVHEFSIFPRPPSLRLPPFVPLFRVDFVHGLLKSCKGFDFVHGLLKSCALWAFELIQSPRFCARLCWILVSFLVHTIARRLRVLCCDSRASDCPKPSGITGVFEFDFMSS